MVGCGRSAAALAELNALLPWQEQERLSSSAAGTLPFAAIDVADPGAVEAWASRLHDAGFIPDLVLNNAALMNDLAPLWEIPAAQFDQLLAVNVGGLANVVRSFVPRMLAASQTTSTPATPTRTRVIVNFSSGWGRSASPLVGPYCTTKFAVEGFSSSLSQELPEGLAAVCLSPGIINTEMLRKCQPETARQTDSPEPWAERNADILLGLSAADNGRSMSVH